MRPLDPKGLSKSNRLAFLFKDSFIYGSAASISQFFSLLAFPLLTRHFSVVEYGLFDYFMVLSVFLTTLIIFGQDSAVARYFYESKSRLDRCQLISQSLLFQLAGLALLVPLLWWSADKFTILSIVTTDSEMLYKLVLMQLPFLLLISFSQNLLKWTFARTKFLILSLGYTLVRILLLFIAVLVFRVGIKEVLIISLASSAVFGMLGLTFVREWLTLPRGLSKLREMLLFAMPYGFICALGALSPTLERTFTEQILGATDLGLYSAGTKIALMIAMVVGAFQTAWGPFSLSIHQENDAGLTYNLVFRIFTLIMCANVLILTLLAQPLLHLLASNRYSGAEIVVFPLLMGLAIQATSWITEIGISISKKSYLNLYGYFIAAIVTFVGILLFTPLLGLFGVALSVMMGHCAKAIISSLLAQRAYPLPWQYSPVIIVFVFTLIVGFMAIGIGHYFGFHAFALVLSIGLMAVMGGGWRILFNSSERLKLTEFVSAKIKSR
jgi:O-antigen/teichoic acid export membrane protein